MKTYGQFCPVAKASEIFAERWTPLIIRELLMGCHRFGELEMGLPNIPRSLLVQRLRSLEDAGVIERKPDPKGRKPGYHLTTAGAELFDIVKGLGDWGQRWANHDVGDEDVDPALLMWDMHRRIHMDKLPDRRVVVQFDFYGLRKGTYWQVMERPDPSVCLHPPGFDVDLFIKADTLALHRIWMGKLQWADALKQELIEIDGPTPLVRDFPNWLALSMFSDIPSALGTA